MNGRWLLASDLDGTLLGDRSALERFCGWLGEHRSNVTLVYATGRTVVDVQGLVQSGDLPAPDHVIGSVGTEVVAYGTCAPADGWAARAGPNWRREAVCQALAAITDMRPQPDEFQSEFKVSYFLERATAEQLRRVAAHLAALPMPADVIYSGNRFVDILPRGMNKGAAVAFLAQRLQFQNDEVIACGDSGNDLSMCERGFRAVLVANADPDLIRAARPPRYHSPLSHADGVVDGIEFWTTARRHGPRGTPAPRPG